MRMRKKKRREGGWKESINGSELKKVNHEELNEGGSPKEEDRNDEAEKGYRATLGSHMVIKKVCICHEQ